ncbi:MAG: SPOR domain-containing protein [Balneolaceae bacterium]
MILLIAVSCSPTETVTERDREGAGVEERGSLFDLPDEVVDDFLAENMSDWERLLFQSRSSLSDQYASIGGDVPDVFLQQIEEEETVVDRYAGYRVQLYTTRSVQIADSIRNEFLVWADSVFAGFDPNAYVLFRSPNYRVRAGDFRDRDRAVAFSRLLKNRYPDAWVVHDRIEPGRIPGEQIEIRFRTAEEADSLRALEPFR